MKCNQKVNIFREIKTGHKFTYPEYLQVKQGFELISTETCMGEITACLEVTYDKTIDITFACSKCGNIYQELEEIIDIEKIEMLLNKYIEELED